MDNKIQQWDREKKRISSYIQVNKIKISIYGS